MKKSLLFILAILSICSPVFAQNPPANCSELFISEYAQGQQNNRALEIYNPTNREIDLSAYQVGRNSNGLPDTYLTSFPAGAKIPPYKTYVLLCDKRDTAKYLNPTDGGGSGYPVFNGYEKWDTCKDANGVVLLDSFTRKPQFCVQGVTIGTFTGVPVQGRQYNDFLDLQCRAKTNGGYVNGDYNVNRTMYFNGNDGMLLFKSTPADLIGFTNLVDMVGVYNDPGMKTATAWKDWRGRSITESTTMLRKREVKTGTGLVAYSRGDTLKYADWTVFSNNKFTPSFQNLGSHTCDCDPAPPVSSRRLCNGTIIVASEEVLPARFHIYPNPAASGNVTLEADAKIENIQVIDLMGRVVENRAVPIAGERVQLTLNVPTSGLYFVRITTTDKRIGVQKLMIKN